MTTQQLESPMLGQHIVLEDVSWETYERLLREVGEQNLRLTYDEGRLEIMSPLPVHEMWKKLLARMIELLTLELNIPMACLGSTTFRRKEQLKGLEPDECYYIEHEPTIRGKQRFDLRRDPPPDLAVESDVTNRSIDREPIYAALGVPELWRYDGRRLTALKLGDDGQYEPIERSLSFPFLRVRDLERFMRMVPKTEQTSIMRAFKDWMRRQEWGPRR